MNTSSQVSYREWALFGLRLIPSAALFLHLMADADGLAPDSVVILVGLALFSLITNLIYGALLLNDRWHRLFPAATIAADTLVAVGAVFAVGPALGWLGVIPAATAGFFYEWLVGLIVGSVNAVALLIGILAGAGGVFPPLPALVVPLFTAPVVGPLTALLRSDDRELTNMRDQLRLRGQRAERASRTANEYMRVIAEMAEVLSASKLNPRRVLSSAVNVGLAGLERVGLKPPLYGAIFLFGNTPDGLMLRMSQASMSVFASDHRAILPGIGGAIGKALDRGEPVISHVPSSDSELRLTETFRSCKTVLCLPLLSGTEYYGVMLIGSTEEDAFKDVHVELMLAVANQTAASLNNAQLYVSLLEQRDRLVEVEKSARAQLASDLHDGPTQSVAAITMRLNFIRRLIEKKPDQALSELYSIEDMARRATKEIRQMLFELRPKALDDGLEAGLRQLADRMQETFEQQVDIQFQPRVDELLDPQVRQTLFSIATESVNNARKHSGAEVIYVQVGVQGDNFVMAVVDDGRGFDVEQAIEHSRQREGHLGLINLQERAALLEGALDIQSAPGEGTRLSVLIPLHTLRQRKEEYENRMRDRDEDEFEGLSSATTASRRG